VRFGGNFQRTLLYHSLTHSFPDTHTHTHVRLSSPVSWTPCTLKFGWRDWERPRKQSS